MSTSVHIHINPQHIATLTFHHPSQSTNVINKAFIEDLTQAIDTVERQQVKGIIMTSSKSTFIAGADIHYIKSMIQSDDHINRLNSSIGSIHALFRRIEQLNIPVVAAMNGSTLGGGFELALACHHRIAIDHPNVSVGLPEATLGILPGLGGCIRTCRLLGYQQGLTLLLKGSVLSPKKAYEIGWIDGTAKDEEHLRSLAMDWITQNPNPKQPWDMGTATIPQQPWTPEGNLTWMAANSLCRNQSFGLYPNLKYILQACYESSFLSFDQALTVEQQYFIKAAMSPEASSMLTTQFIDRQRLKKGYQRPNIPHKQVNSLLICGTGFMGQGIAISALRANIKVWIADIDEAHVLIAHKNILQQLNQLSATGKITQEQLQLAESNLNVVTQLETCPAMDLIIEAIVESKEEKTAFYKSLQPIITQETVLASNTSTLPISLLGQSLPFNERFIGIHFFSPVEKMHLVEIIKGNKTDDKTTALAIDFVNQLNKTPIVVNDGPGFFTTRVVMSYVDEGLRMLGEGISPTLIERAGKHIGMPVGPLSLVDEIGIDIAHHIQQQTSTFTTLNPSPSPAFDIIEKMTTLQRLGRKNQCGFYTYPPNETKLLWPQMKTALDLPPPKNTDFKLIKQRLLFRQLAETTGAIQDNIISQPEAINVGAVFGWGFCPWSGGPISLMQTMGSNALISQANHLTSLLGQRFYIHEESIKPYLQTTEKADE